MAGQNDQKVKVKTTKELTDAVNNLKNENKMLTEQVKELDKIVKNVVKQLVNLDEEKKGPKEVANDGNTFKCNNCEEIFVSKKAKKEHIKGNFVMKNSQKTGNWKHT